MAKGFFAQSRKWISFLVMTALLVVSFTIHQQPVPQARAIMIEQSKGMEECFYETVHAGSPITGSYIILFPSDAKMDVKVLAPRPEGAPADKAENPKLAGGDTVYVDENTVQGFFSLVPEVSGTYQFCFLPNSGSSRKVTVSFMFDSGEKPPQIQELAKNTQIDKLGSYAYMVSEQISTFQFKQSEADLRMRRHVEILQSVEFRLKVWSRILMALVALFAAGQVIFLQRLFLSKSRSSSIRV